MSLALMPFPGPTCLSLSLTLGILKRIMSGISTASVRGKKVQARPITARHLCGKLNFPDGRRRVSVRPHNKHISTAPVGQKARRDEEAASSQKVQASLTSDRSTHTSGLCIAQSAPLIDCGRCSFLYVVCGLCSNIFLPNNAPLRPLNPQCHTLLHHHVPPGIGVAIRNTDLELSGKSRTPLPRCLRPLRYASVSSSGCRALGLLRQPHQCSLNNLAGLFARKSVDVDVNDVYRPVTACEEASCWIAVCQGEDRHVSISLGRGCRGNGPDSE